MLVHLVLTIVNVLKTQINAFNAINFQAREYETSLLLNSYCYYFKQKRTLSPKCYVIHIALAWFPKQICPVKLELFFITSFRAHDDTLNTTMSDWYPSKEN